jgi:hypothetical protein
MTQQNLLELAKKGNVQAISSLMNRQLKNKGITAKLALKDGCLQVMLESTEVPDQQIFVEFVRKGIIGLRVASIERVKIYGRQIDEEFPAWNTDFEVVIEVNYSSATSANNSYSNFSSKQSQHLEQPSITQKNKETNKYYDIEGSNGQVRLTPNRIIISRKGVTAFMTQGLKGDKEIPISRITAVQFKRADAFTKGYLQFSIQGGIESRGGVFAAVSDENSIMFNELEQAEFEEVKRYVNSVIDDEPIEFDQLRFLELKTVRMAKHQKQIEDIKKGYEAQKVFAKKLVKPLLIILTISFAIMCFSPNASALQVLSILTFVITGGSLIIAGFVILDERVL